MCICMLPVTHTYERSDLCVSVSKHAHTNAHTLTCIAGALLQNGTKTKITMQIYMYIDGRGINQNRTWYQHTTLTLLILLILFSIVKSRFLLKTEAANSCACVRVYKWAGLIIYFKLKFRDKVDFVMGICTRSIRRIWAICWYHLQVLFMLRPSSALTQTQACVSVTYGQWHTNK